MGTYNWHWINPYAPPMVNPVSVPGNGHEAVAPSAGEASKASPEAIPKDKARIRIVVPTSDARVWIESALTQKTGLERQFMTPSLEAGQRYTYTIKATWKDQSGQEIRREKEVSIQAGQEAVVKF